MCPLSCPGLFTSDWKLGSNQPEEVSQAISLSRGDPASPSVSGQSSGMRTALPGVTVLFPRDPYSGTKDSRELHFWRGSCRILMPGNTVDRSPRWGQLWF